MLSKAEGLKKLSKALARYAVRDAVSWYEWGRTPQFIKTVCRLIF
jgi:hypothetical protein